MAQEKISYARLDWQPGSHPLERKKAGSLGGAVLLRFEPGFSDPKWCGNGHAGYVLEGRLRFELAETRMDVDAGEGFVLDAGTRHRASNPGAVPVVLFIAPRG
jgi:quercetin dioxygenase-like cupin family protein